MKQITSVAEMQAEARQLLKRDVTIGLVPTMGALHEGHLSLIRKAAEENDEVVVSIFVNPIQFNDSKDLDNYPRTLEEDLALAEDAGATIVFTPEAEHMYHSDNETMVQVTRLTNHLCGIARGSGHFIGVCTVVAKLFNIVHPDVAYFGQKDAQQALVIQRMVRDLNFPLKVEICPIIREKDGLAMSSRNKRLTDEQREEALALFGALELGKELIESGEKNSLTVINQMCEHILAHGDIEIDYMNIVSTETLDDVETIDEMVLLAGAVFVGDVRLIDNMLVDPAC